MLGSVSDVRGAELGVSSMLVTSVLSNVSAYGTNQGDFIREDFRLIVVTEGTKMRQKSQTRQTGAAKAIKDIRRATRKQYSAEEKIRIVLDGLRGEETIAELCVEKASPRAFIINGRRSFSRQASVGLPVIRPERLLRAMLRPCAVKRVI